MARLLVHVEGETEESFVNEVLGPHLVGQHGYEAVSARIIGNARQRSRRGGIRPWRDVKNDILRHLKEDRRCVATTMVDYYGLPAHGDRAWPGRETARTQQANAKPSIVEQAVATDLNVAMGGAFDTRRFVPFVVMHEFEGLLFSECTTFANAIGRSALADPFQRIRDEFHTPEDINDSPLTAPSKRVMELMPQYEKPLFGTLAALAIGLDAIRNECPHFAEWLTRLEDLAQIDFS